MFVHAKATLNAKTDLLLIEAASSGGGQWGRPVVLRLVEFPKGMEYTNILNPHAKQVDFEFLDGRHKGPRSYFGRTKEYMLCKMENRARGSITVFE
ncbi:hypothetical protein [Paraburkholderia sp. C35]|uniref:hypothetical protein n=1 Tax=Paraburkholderia sp. C35 TaxID=2126993 RepID=UPI000D689653|nr:hypothetical protein [Paraburkholderia sp. C35]